MESTAAAAKAKAKLKANKKEEKDRNQKGKIAKGKGKEVVLNYAKFEGQGLSFKAKLFGFVEVPGPRGDQSSIQAIQKLKQQAKQLKKGANEHKLKITFNITLQGVRLFNEKTQTIEHEHPIHKISFISHDPEDRHVFGYIYSPPRSAPNEARKYYLFAIKSDKSADAITVQLYELFQVVYKIQESRKAKSKENSALKPKQQDESSQPLEPLQDKMLLEMSNKIGGDQQQSPADEHLYEEPTFVKPAAPESTSDAELGMPSDQPVQASSSNESNEYIKAPRPQNDMSENTDVATNFALSLNLSESETSHALSDSVSTPTSNGDSRFEAVFDSTLSFPTKQISNENTFHADFPPFENGFASSENNKSFQDLPENFNDVENKDMPISNKASLSNQIPFGDYPTNADVTTDSETSQNESASLENQGSLEEPAETIHFTETEDKNVGSTKFQSEENLTDLSIPPTVDFSSFESEKQNDSNVNDADTENTGAAKSNKFVSQVSSFEVNFDTDEDDRTLKQNEQNKLALEPTSDPFTSQNAFSVQDPFASTSPTEFDQAAFGTFPDDDPFSPKGGGNIDTKSDPFVNNNDPFITSFTIEEPGENNSDQQNDQQSESSKEDVFETIFEAKMDEEFEVENFDKDNKEWPNNIENTVEFESYGEENKELDSQEKGVNETLEKDENINTMEAVEVLKSSPDKENLNELQQEKAETDENEKEKLNTFDFSSSDVYVTLKTATSPSNGELSPTEFSPPPLPPRPAISRESLETIASPKIPPALPPRPPVHLSETALRKPPELPPRVDLEEKNSVDNEMLRSTQENNSETFDNAASPTFQTNFESFNFNKSESNAPVVGSPTFDTSDPFKDPFAGADPFQTPVAGDPFASPVSFERDSQRVKDNLDPFSGDDPFAMTPAFDTEASFNSSFNSNLPEPNNEAGNDAEKDKFADFSSAFS